MANKTGNSNILHYTQAIDRQLRRQVRCFSDPKSAVLPLYYSACVFLRNKVISTAGFDCHIGLHAEVGDDRGNCCSDSF